MSCNGLTFMDVKLQAKDNMASAACFHDHGNGTKNGSAPNMDLHAGYVCTLNLQQEEEKSSKDGKRKKRKEANIRRLTALVASMSR